MARAPETEVVHLDTHVVCWLYEGRADLLSVDAKEMVELGDLVVSPIVDLELQFLHETGRIVKGPEKVLASLGREIGLRIATTTYGEVVATARRLEWTRDPFDRLIVADAARAGAKLVTKDRVIRRHYADAVW